MKLGSLFIFYLKRSGSIYKHYYAQMNAQNGYVDSYCLKTVWLMRHQP